MGNFYGTVTGSTMTKVSRRGTISLTTTAQAWGGMVVVYLYIKDGVDYAHIRLDTVGDYDNRTGRYLKLYDGPVNPTNEEVVNNLVPLKNLTGELGFNALLHNCDLIDRR